ncbi:Zinc transporter [Coemansia sp. RSA 2708]|nr:Zinc transporter [Coemansia sp. RSA 2708]
MAYTSISVLTSESIEHLENVAALAKYKGVVAAALFVVGALFNLLLGRVVTLIMPRDSPIKHACGSHPPSPGESQDEEAQADGHDSSSRTVDAEGSGCSSRGSTQSAHAHAEHQPLLLRSDAAGCRCEYACTRPGCYTLEHCHITPLYPHVHMHGQGSSHAHAQANGDAGGGGAAAGGHCGHAHAHSHGQEPAVRLAGPGGRSASQISSHHQRLLIHVGLQTAVAIGLHKIPEGLVIYLSRRASPKLGVSVAASLFFHNLPEGIMLALPLFLATGRRHMAFAVASLMGAAPPAVGAALGTLVLSDVGRKDARLAAIFAVAFGVTAGMMCMVSLNGMLPTARIYDKSGNIVAWCFALGVAFMLFANASLE